MKKSLIICIFALSCLSTFNVNAQKYRLEVGYGNPVRHGSNVSSTYFDGLKVGVTAEFGFKYNFSLLTGALYNFVYSNKTQNYPNSQYARYSSYGHSIEIPLHAYYTLPLFRNVKAFGYAGPKLNIGLFQSEKINSTVSSSVITINSTHREDLYKDSQLNRLNLQIGLGGGVQWKKLQLKSGYDWGLNNLNKASTGGNQYQKGWYISLGYEF